VIPLNPNIYLRVLAGMILTQLHASTDHFWISLGFWVAAWIVLLGAVRAGIRQSRVPA
jgi:hypothetical protein